MSLYELLSLIIAAAGFIVVAITLIILIKQVGQMTIQTKYVAKSLKVSAYESVANQMVMVDEVFIRQPEFRPYFYSGKCINKDDADYDKVVAIAELILDVSDSVLIQSKQFPQVWPQRWWGEYIIDSFSNSPLLCEYLSTLQNWYTKDLIALMRKGEARRLHSNT